MIFGRSRMITSACTLVLVALQAVTIEADWGCYTTPACDCSPEVCSLETCEATNGYWTGACTSCSCLCDSEATTFTAKVDLFAGELGYFSFTECDDLNPNPTLQMKVGETYTFDQTDISNYYHPMGFAYGPDGALSENDELEPGVGGEASTCDSAGNACPAPIYEANGVILGTYNNLVDGSLTSTDNFGLDDYEPKFFLPLATWASVEYTVKLRFNDASFAQDFFYFCHIHKGMSGRIVLTDSDGVLLSDDRLPAADGFYHSYATGTSAKTEFDTGCGTYQLEQFLPVEANTAECLETFVCDTNDLEANADVTKYAKCIDAMNCEMMKGMTSKATSTKDLFLYQMIPHHRNAVQMAKALLKIEDYNCSDFEDETTACILEGIAREIITGQNFQIQTMYGLLATIVDPIDVQVAIVSNDCEVAFREVTAFPTTDPTSSPTGDPTGSPTSDGDEPCFSAVTTAFVSGKGSVTMDLIEVGDSVLTGSGEFQPVYSIDHRDMNKSTQFVQIGFGNDHNVLEVTPKHMIFEEGKVNPVASGTIDVGDRVVTPTGYETVTSIGMVERKGVFNPLTADGTIVASGLVASTFSSLLNHNDSIEISGRSIMSYQQFFTNLVKPYKFYCTTLSLELCRADSEKVMVSELASRIFFFHNNGDSQASLLSFVAFLLSIMETIVLPLVYISVPVGILRLVCSGKK